MDNKNEFKPYIPANKIVPEFTVTSVLIGIILAVVFGAANAYLGLLVGMTISASIPAAERSISAEGSYREHPKSMHTKISTHAAVHRFIM